MESSPEDWRDQVVAMLPKVRRFAYALTGSAADADDLLQSTVERLLMKPPPDGGADRPERWMFRICRNIWIDEVRARKMRGETVEINPDQVGPAVDGVGVATARLTLADVEERMNALSSEQRSVLALVAVEGLSYKETAAVLDLPIGTVMSRLARARKQLADMLDPTDDAR